MFEIHAVCSTLPSFYCDPSELHRIIWKLLSTTRGVFTTSKCTGTILSSEYSIKSGLYTLEFSSSISKGICLFTLHVKFGLQPSSIRWRQSTYHSYSRSHLRQGWHQTAKSCRGSEDQIASVRFICIQTSILYLLSLCTMKINNEVSQSPRSCPHTSSKSAISKSTTAIPQEFQMIPCKAYRKWASGEGDFAYTVRNKSSAATKESSACVVAAQPRYWDYAPFCWKCFTHEDIVRHFGKGWQGSCLSYMTVDHHHSDNLIHNDSG